MNIYVVRHGQTEANAKNFFNGINTLDLTAIGVKQAEELAPKMENISIDYIFCSPLKRAMHTANILNVKNKKISIDDRLIERECGKYTLKPTSLIKDIDALYDKEKNKYQDFEPFSEIIKRVASFIQEIKEKYKDKDILVVTHGDIILGFQEYFNRRDDGYPNTCELSKFEI